MKNYRPSSFAILGALVFAVPFTLFGPVTPEASAEPSCRAFANPPVLVAGQVEANGGVTCTSSGTGLFRVDVTLYRDGSEVGFAANTCHGEQQCGAVMRAPDVAGDQRWCTATVGALTGSGLAGSGSAPRTQQVCETESF